MSASMVRKSLAIVDKDFNRNKGKTKSGKKKSVANLIPDNHKIKKKINRKGHKETVEVLKTEAKLTVAEARKHCKSKDEILKENLRKLKLIQEHSKVDLEEEVTHQLIERAITKRPVKTKVKKGVQKTAFTEEDFAKFEAEYFDE
ncbi:hypothetical protein ILUMI_01266 [Ignelater luminosus]|uniref:Active regulator of SIRT1 n=1 Tax=Ignelater luminosus TaxID=2038154 RepID=A0A8K0DEP3_IGNLU|nr:hypothetical protein ILUMI_01266 [Ignelater luminosus]